MVEASQERDTSFVQPTTSTEAAGQVKNTGKGPAITSQETGATWDEPLGLYKHGQVNINFYNNQIGYTAGDCVAGTVDVVIKQSFPSKALVLQLVGVERAHLNVDLSQVKSFHRETKEIVKLETVMATYAEDSQLQPGHYTFPF